ncbi:PorP/SprF family type IX secretion system membrane protein [Solitalea canadensis]|uniref:Bacteroidetes-specific putative membrane protein n=1 Tax=Solitalea canadensis (strain ATCC 29591 / DSM 3403 / JCM 21819 / LMG 8368 / NBRC 15130 / NCIMB 12057 / USAM 9D) TaxID=929556 RepID=H8KSR5_SOLCM|nr:type IX secretion system membrane protein PorP/SprF [Solitalea canadensis]AFD05209.1 Bacteroidetes-specific putative membrane protein [Solitalea canadensis DSM 3403]
MKRIYKVVATVLLAISANSTFAQQNVQFSQYVFNGLAVNPAYAGYKEEWTAQVLYRTQWVNLPGAPKTGTLSIDGLTDFNRKNMGLGFQVTTDQLGPQKTFSAYANYSYRLRLDEYDTKRLCFGLGLGISQYSLTGDDLTYIDLDDQGIPVGTQSTMSPDLRFGVYYYSPNFYAGASVMDLFADYMATKLQGVDATFPVIKKTRHYYVTAGGLIQLNEKISWKPSFLVKDDFNGPTNLDLTSFLAYDNKVWLGASWRTGIKLWGQDHLKSNLRMADAYSILAQFYVSDRFRVGYAYDHSLNDLSSYEDGSHEISLSFSIPSRKRAEKVLSPRYF